MALTLTNDILKFRESTSDPWERLLIQANMNFNLIYPVGSIYMSTVDVDPGTIFGGTWERLKDRFLLGAGDTYTAGDTGGSNVIDISHKHTTQAHTLTLNEIPSHNHTMALANTDASLSSYARFGYNGEAFRGNTGSSGGGQAHSHGDTGSAGSASQSIMPPYLVVYMWRRLTLSPTIYTPPSSVILGEVATENVVPIAKGGTGSTTTAGAKENLGIVSAVNAASSSGVVPFVLSVSEGGTGANNAADARENLGVEVEFLYSYTDANTNILIMRFLNTYHIHLDRYTTVASATNVITIDSAYAPNSAKNAFCYYGSVLSQAQLGTDGKITLYSGNGNATAGVYDFYFQK